MRKMDAVYALQSLPASSSTLFTLLNLLIIAGILAAIALFIFMRGEDDEKKLIRGFEFMHEVDPLPSYEAPGFTYLF